MNNITVFNQQEVLGQNFTVYGDINSPLFLAKDVAEWIDYSKTGKGAYDVSKMLKTIDDDEKTIRTIFVSEQKRDMWFVTEDGLYEILMLSRKPIAKQFKKEVKKILKELRLNGKVELVQDSYMIEDPVARAERWIEEQKELQLALQTIEEQKPKAIFADAVQTADTTIPIGDLAKLLNQNGIEIGRNRLFSWLREHGYLIKAKTAEYNSPTQKSMNQGLFTIDEKIDIRKDESVDILKTTRVTGKGQIYFVNKFLTGEVEIED